ncbi:hypothetical protein E2C01_001718 [Portunus trituberculatus]|uniref:Uncharacterized protein n=1 Tax=Portunus trituberculatus TaxID=210409 RepID=A0A5B7CIM9_PORTR|nr:hypothetical protein [Portunus trituberculatus]
MNMETIHSTQGVKVNCLGVGEKRYIFHHLKSGWLVFYCLTSLILDKMV